MASIGDTRITSNGCKVAQRVPRKDAGCRQPSDNIAAIDFGTTNCSVAYILPGEMDEQGPTKLAFEGTFYRVPTAVLFNKDGIVDSFGTEAREDYCNLEDRERLERAYFEQIKMDLQHDEVPLKYQYNYIELCTVDVCACESIKTCIILGCK